MEEKKCPFCEVNGIEKKQELITKGNLWYALIPYDPHIFGHVLVTYSNGSKNGIQGI